MPSDLNSVNLVGRLTRDAELKSLTSTTVCTFSLAVNRNTKLQDGSWGSEVSFFDVELYGRLGEAIHSYLRKGKQVAVEGRLQQNRWEQEGQKKSRILIIANNLQLLGASDDQSRYPPGKPGGSPPSTANSMETPANFSGNSANEDLQDDIPF